MTIFQLRDLLHDLRFSCLLECSVFVNGRPRSVVMEDMQKRIDRADIKQEKLDAIQVTYPLVNDCDLDQTNEICRQYVT